MGLQDYGKSPNRRNPLQTHLWHETVISVEVGITSIRRGMFHEGSNDDQLRINLDYLDEIRVKASNKIMKYQQKMTKYYNRRVKLRRLNIGDLVPLKVTPATKNAT